MKRGVIEADKPKKAGGKKVAKTLGRTMAAFLAAGIALIALAIFGGSSFMLPALLATSAILLIPNRKGEKAQ